MNIVDYADLYAERAHRDQKRKYSEEPYIVHPRQVAEKLMWYNKQPMHGEFMGCKTCLLFSHTDFAVAYLHDVIEDCNITYEQLCDDFNYAVAGGVRALSNTSKITNPTASRATRKRLDREHIAKADSHTQSIKAVDRMVNLGDIGQHDPSFLKVYLAESKLLADVLVHADVRIREELYATIERLSNNEPAAVLREVQEQVG